MQPGLEVWKQFFRFILRPPMLSDRIGHFRKPRCVLTPLDNFGRREVFHAIRLRIAKWTQEPASDEDGHVVNLAIEDPCHLFRRQAARKAAQKRKESVLVIFHALLNSGRLWACVSHHATGAVAFIYGSGDIALANSKALQNLCREHREFYFERSRTAMDQLVDRA